MHWSRRTFWLNVGFICWYWVWQSAHFTIDLDTDTRWEFVSLFSAGIQLAKSQLYLVEIVKLASHSDISVTSNVSGLLGAQHKLERGLLKSAAPCK